MHKQDQYIPALRYDWLTALYDPLIRWGLREDTFKQRFWEQSDCLLPKNPDGNFIVYAACGLALGYVFS